MKRTDYINWDEYFMGIALLTAMRSKDPSSQVGACIVSPENKTMHRAMTSMLVVVLPVTNRKSTWLLNTRVPV